MMREVDARTISRNSEGFEGEERESDSYATRESELEKRSYSEFRASGGQERLVVGCSSRKNRQRKNLTNST